MQTRIMNRGTADWLVCIAALAAPWLAAAQQAPRWPDNGTTRLEALALVQTLNADLLASRSATRTLENWCRDHRLAAEPRIVAQQTRGIDKAPSAEQRQRLQVDEREVVKYRHVQLVCGAHVLSVAENWYVPGRLTPEMNRLLETTETPFGRAVEDLQPYRQAFAVALLWSPLPAGWETGARRARSGGRQLAIPESLFEHRAVLYSKDHLPIAEVAEIYQRAVLAFPAPRLH